MCLGCASAKNAWFLGGQHVTYSVLQHRPAYTAQEEAAAAHVTGSQWAKTVSCFADGRPILAVVPAPSLIDVDRLRAVTGARNVRLANEREFEGLYPDCEIGAMPPLGPLYDQPVFIDRPLATGDEIVFDARSRPTANRSNLGHSPVGFDQVSGSRRLQI